MINATKGNSRAHFGQWAYFGYTMGTLWTHFGHTQGTLWAHSESENTLLTSLAASATCNPQDALLLFLGVI